jgi:hypothetical protein
MIRGALIEPALRLGIEAYAAVKGGNQRAGTPFLQTALLTTRLSLLIGPELSP